MSHLSKEDDGILEKGMATNPAPTKDDAVT
jgi:hypothetical protein